MSSPKQTEPMSRVRTSPHHQHIDIDICRCHYKKATPQDATARTKLPEYGNPPQTKHRLRIGIIFKPRTERIQDPSQVQARVQYKQHKMSPATLPLSSTVYKMIIYYY